MSSDDLCIAYDLAVFASLPHKDSSDSDSERGQQLATLNLQLKKTSGSISLLQN